MWYVSAVVVALGVLWVLNAAHKVDMNIVVTRSPNVS